MIRRIIGAVMRLYRRSPLHGPGVGRHLARVLSFLPRPNHVVRRISGLMFRLDLDEIIDASLFFSGTFEADAERAIQKVLRPGMIAIDVGANVGYHTLRMARAVGPEGRVLAIEPTSRAVARLKDNINLNGFQNVEVLQVGVGLMDEAQRKIAFRSSYRLDGREDRSEEWVKMHTLDSITSGLTRLDFIKVDVDGYEAKVFAGARETLLRFRPTVLFEIGPPAMLRQGDSAQDLIDLFRSLGYRFRTERGEPLDDPGALFRGLAGEDTLNLLAEPAVEARVIPGGARP